MSENLISALWITLLGMGLVFSAIILLWAVMSILVRLTTVKNDNELETNTQTEIEQKRKAAGVAVAIALARQADSTEPHEFPLPSTALVSAWQAVMRTRMHNKRGSTR